MYCEDCMHIVDAEPCPICGESNVRETRQDDVCHLIQVLPLWGKPVEDLLNQSGIPHLRKSSLGAGMVMKAGAFLEEIRFYVRYGDLLRARETIAGLFPEAVEEEDPAEPIS